MGGCGGVEYDGEAVGLALVAGALVALAVDGLVGFGVGVDEGAEQFGIVVGEVAAEGDAAVDGLQRERFPLVGCLLVRLGTVLASTLQYLAASVNSAATSWPFGNRPTAPFAIRGNA